MAKRRNWNIRQSIKRASRRLTGRKDDPRSERDKRKRSGMVAGSKKSGTTAAHPPGSKHGIAVEVKDVEKGQADGNGGGANGIHRDTWLKKLQGNNWKK